MFRIALLLLLANPAAQAAEPPRPNIVYILADDLGYGDIHHLNPEHGKILTPNLDRLAAQGMVFTDAHSASSVCTPTRYGILTGRYAWRTGLQSGVLRPYDPPLIAAGRLTVPALLRQRGYQTACVGKWHLGWEWPRAGKEVVFDRPIREGPTTRGFQYYFGTDVPNYPPYGFIENDCLPVQPSAVCEPDKKLVLHVRGPMVPGWQFDQILPRLTQKAVEYIAGRAADKKPFFLYFPLTSPHEPIAPSAQFRGRSGLSPVADFIMETDWAAGQIIDALDKNGLAGSTLLIFTADNGHCTYTGIQPLLDAGHRPSQRFRGYKSDIWEGGHRIPFIVRWPGKVKPGTTCDKLICLTDLMATCADLLQTKLPDNAGEDSVSILSALRGSEAGPRHEAVVHHSCNGRFSLRQGQWKLELCPGSGGYGGTPSDAQAAKQRLPPVQLYDMSRDDTETANVQDKHPAVVARLTGLLQQYVTQGRSTPGTPQANDVAVEIWKPLAKPAAKSAAKPRAKPRLADDRPNILFILADDHASQAIGCYGSRLAKTPSIDRIAAAGIRFDRCFCTESICGPSRATIMTGKYGHVTGAMGWLPYDRRHRTFPEYLQAAGYQTALVGKYHLGQKPPGFDDYQILPGQGRYLNPELVSKAGKKTHPGHVSDVITDVGLDWLARRDPGRPFLLCVHHKATHMPWQPAPRHEQLFAETRFPEPPTLLDDFAGRADCAKLSILKVDNLLRWQKGWPAPPTGDSAQRTRALYQEYLRHYLRTAAGMDENIGRLLDYLDRQRLAENTIVIYSSDQGFFLGEHGWFDKRWMLEESLRMPLVVRYPKMVRPPAESSALVLNVDFAPTLLDLAGLSVPGDMQGRSLRPILAGRAAEDWRKAIYYRYYAQEYGIPPQFGLRTDRYKLIHYAGPVGLDDGTTLAKPKQWREVDQWELFDLQKDPQEQTNLYNRPESAKLVADLKAQLTRLRRQLGDLE